MMKVKELIMMIKMKMIVLTLKTLTSEYVNLRYNRYYIYVFSGLSGLPGIQGDKGCQ